MPGEDEPETTRGRRSEFGSFLKPSTMRIPESSPTKCEEEEEEEEEGEGEGDMETNGEQFCFVEVALEDGESETLTMVRGAGINSAVNGVPEGAQGGPVGQITREESSDDPPAKRRRNKRSVIWNHYEQIDNLAAARCSICLKVQSFQGGSTSNLHRHLSKRHPEVFSQLTGDRLHPAPPRSSQSSNANVEVTLEDGDSDVLNSAINGILEDEREGPGEQITREGVSDDHPVKRRRNKRSLIWKHFEQLDSLAAARCRICMKKLHYFEGSSTSNLHRHMSKRHLEVFSQLLEDEQHPSPPHASQSSNAYGDPSTPPETETPRQSSGLLKASRVSGGEKRAFRRELELIEALRRAQKEEAQALEHQRELLEKLRALNAREAAAEREQIESLRKAQLEEAKDLSRQRLEMHKEKTLLQKKWEELQKGREELALSSSRQQAS